MAPVASYGYVVFILLLLALFSVVYVPLMSVLLLRRLQVFKEIRATFLLPLQILLFFVFAALTVIIIRANPFDNPGWLLLYAIVITVAYNLLAYYQRKKKAATTLQSNDPAQ